MALNMGPLDWKSSALTTRPLLLTCLSLMWKLLTGVTADQIYAHLDHKKLLPEEQKGCRKGSRGTNDLLYIYISVIKEVKSRNKNLESL